MHHIIEFEKKRAAVSAQGVGLLSIITDQNLDQWYKHEADR